VSNSLRCTICGCHSSEKDWSKEEVTCSVCGHHEAIKCPFCEEIFDISYIQDHEKRVQMKEISKEYIKELIGHDQCFVLDVGCYTGSDGAEIAELMPKCEVVCFEADPRSQQLFDKFNGNNKKMILYPMAMGNVDGPIDFYPSYSDTRRHFDFQESWSASGSTKKAKEHLNLFPDVEFNGSIKVACVRLDTWYAFHAFPRPIDFAWVDLNGSEEDFILGGINTLSNHTRFLYIEFSDKELYEGQITKKKILEMLPNFILIDIFNLGDNFGNLLLKNIKI